MGFSLTALLGAGGPADAGSPPAELAPLTAETIPATLKEPPVKRLPVEKRLPIEKPEPVEKSEPELTLSPESEAAPSASDETPVPRFHDVRDILSVRAPDADEWATLVDVTDEAPAPQKVRPDPAPETRILSTSTRPHVLVEARMIALDPKAKLSLAGDVEFRPRTAADSGAIVVSKPDAATSRWADELAKNEKQVFLMPIVGGESGQLTQIEQVAYISEFRVERSGDAMVADPVVSTLQHGLVLNVKPTPVADGVRLQLSLELSHLDELLEREIDLIRGASAVTIQVPVMARHETKIDKTVADGGRLLIVTRRPTDDGKEEMILIDLFARITLPSDSRTVAPKRGQ